jgi:hypothetical protein
MGTLSSALVLFFDVADAIKSERMNNNKNHHFPNLIATLVYITMTLVAAIIYLFGEI